MSFRGIFAPAWRHVARHTAFIFLSAASGLAVSQSALASNITVASPINGTGVSSTIWVRAHNVGCNGLRPQAFGYSVDNSTSIAWGVTPYDIDVTKVPVKPGTHTIHFKSWTAHGLCTVVNTNFTVSAISSGSSGSATSGSGSSPSTGGGGSSTGSNASGQGTGSGSTGTNPGSGQIPSNAVTSAYLDGKQWAFEADPAMGGAARGSSVFPATTPLYDDAREFYMTYSRLGGVRWHISFATDTNATHFVYDTYVYVDDPTQLANIEMDMNQVMSDGRTVIFGTQCSVYSKTWEYTFISNGTHWHPSNLPCNPQSWAPKTWHHVQIASHRDGEGNVTYDWVNLDGAHSEFANATVNSAEALGWQKGTLLINFQLDGASKESGTVTAYVHDVTVVRW